MRKLRFKNLSNLSQRSQWVSCEAGTHTQVCGFPDVSPFHPIFPLCFLPMYLLLLKSELLSAPNSHLLLEFSLDDVSIKKWEPPQPPIPPWHVLDILNASSSSWPSILTLLHSKVTSHCASYSIPFSFL